MLAHQASLDEWTERWLYLVKLRDFLRIIYDRYPGPTADRVKFFIETKECLPLSDSEHEIIL